MQGFAARLSACTLLAWIAMLSGCAGSRGPELLNIEADQYDLAFGCAIEAMRKAGLPVELQDRRNGLLESEFRTAGTILEPWRGDSSTVSGTIESTVNHERRKARIEFTPLRFDAEAERADVLTGPDLVAEQIELVDLTRYQGRIEVRAWVEVERSTVVGRRRGDWTRRSSTQAIHPDSGLGPTQTFWTPVNRDTALERRLLRAIESAIAKAAATEDHTAMSRVEEHAVHAAATPE